MQWTPSLETGNAVVDAEHRELLELINKLEFIGDGPYGALASDALEELTDYVFVHFQMEEKLMRREEYPPEAMSAHIAEHRDLDRRTQEMVRDYSEGKFTTIGPILDFLYEWFQHHVVEVDSALAAYVRERHERG